MEMPLHGPHLSTLLDTRDLLPTLAQVPGPPLKPLWNTGPPTPATPPRQGHPTAPSPNTTMSAPSPFRALGLRGKRNPMLGQVDTVKQFVPTMEWCLELIRLIAKQGAGEEGGRRPIILPFISESSFFGDQWTQLGVRGVRCHIPFVSFFGLVTSHSPVPPSGTVTRQLPVSYQLPVSQLFSIVPQNYTSSF